MRRTTTIAVLIFLLIPALCRAAATYAVIVYSSLDEVPNETVSQCIFRGLKNLDGKYYKYINDFGPFDPFKLKKHSRDRLIDYYYFFSFSKKAGRNFVDVTLYDPLFEKVEAGGSYDLSAQDMDACSQALSYFSDLLQPQLTEKSIQLMKQGEIFVRQGDKDEGAQYFSQATQYSTGSGKVYRQMGHVLASVGDIDNAIEWYRHAADMDRREVKAYVGMAKAEEARENYEAAVTYMGFALQRGPVLPAWEKQTAEYYEWLERWELAWRLREEIYEAIPGDVDNLTNLVRSLEHDAEFAKATKYQMKIIQLKPESGVERGRLVELYMRAENYNAAIHILESFTKAAPKETYWRRLLAQCYLGLQDYDKAKQQYYKLLKIVPDDMESRIALAQLAYRQRDFDTAYKYLVYFEKNHVNNVEAYRLLSQIYEMRNDFFSAFEAQRDLIKFSETLSDQDLVRLFELAAKINTNGLLRQAVNEILPYKSRSDRRALVMAIAEGMVKNDQKTEAISYLRNHMDMLRRHGPAYLQLGSLLLDQGDIDGADKVFRDAMTFTTDSTIAMRIGTMFHVRDQYDLAQFYYSLGLGRGTEINPRYQLQYMEASLLNGDMESAMWAMMDISKLKLSPLYQQYFLYLELVYSDLKGEKDFHNQVLAFALSVLEKQGATGRLDLHYFRNLVQQKFTGDRMNFHLALIDLFEGKMQIDEFKKKFNL